MSDTPMISTYAAFWLYRATDARFELDFTTPLELLVALILAAQFRDEQVGRVYLVFVVVTLVVVLLGLAALRRPPRGRPPRSRRAWLRCHRYPTCRLSRPSAHRF